MYRIVTLNRDAHRFVLVPEADIYKTYLEAQKAKDKLQRNNPGIRFFVESFW